jgi:hypothetical protein
MESTFARKITEENEIKIESILSQIENDAKIGKNKHRLPIDVLITDKTKNKLMSLGYKISQQKGFLGEEIFVIEW